MAVLIPSYEPTDRLADVVRGLRLLEPSRHILVVDDGSGPSYADQFRAARPPRAGGAPPPPRRGGGAPPGRRSSSCRATGARAPP